MKLKSKSGFSLVELMVVVAIIGILATIAIPNFQKFQARARQASARTELTGIYTAQKSFVIEYNSFSASLPTIGFVPEDINDTVANYTVKGGVNRVYASSAGPGTIAAGAAACGVAGCPNTGLAYGGQYRSSCTNIANTADWVAPAGTVGAGFAAPVSAATTFIAAVDGCPGSLAGQAAINSDVWNINENRIIANHRSGLARN
ncbi:MAG: type II secretion system protein [Bdellovibrionota bacterium]